MKHPPYHLRTNKAVDRLLLVGVLRALFPDNYRHCTYYSLSGPFLEDLRIMDSAFPGMKLVSLESKLETYKRQEFHRFSSNIELRNSELSKFLRDYEPSAEDGADGADIFWLDYTDFDNAKFEEFQALLIKVPLGSVVRITLRATREIDIDALKDFLPPAQITQLREEKLEAFETKFSKVLPHPRDPFANNADFAQMVQQMVRRSASNALDQAGSDRDFLPIHSTRYDDGTQMLSVTGVVYKRGEEVQMRERLAEVHLVDCDWETPKVIDIPALSTKERFLLEHLLPISSDENAGEVLLNQMTYKIDTEKKSKLQLAQYADYFREYPHFIRITG